MGSACQWRAESSNLNSSIDEMMQGWNMPVLKEDLQVEVDKLVEELGFSEREEFIWRGGQQL